MAACRNGGQAYKPAVAALSAWRHRLAVLGRNGGQAYKPAVAVGDSGGGKSTAGRNGGQAYKPAVDPAS